MANILSNKYGLQYIDLSGVPINTDALQIITEKTSKEAQMAIFKKVDKKLSIAVRSPNNKKATEVIKELEERGYILTLFMASSNSIEHAIKRYADISFAVKTETGMLDISGEEIRSILNSIKSVEDIKKIVDETLK